MAWLGNEGCLDIIRMGKHFIVGTGGKERRLCIVRQTSNIAIRGTYVEVRIPVEGIGQK